MKLTSQTWSAICLTPTAWRAESVLIDENFCRKPEHQNRLLSVVHVRRLQGLSLKRLRYRWAGSSSRQLVDKCP